MRQGKKWLRDEILDKDLSPGLVRTAMGSGPVYRKRAGTGQASSIHIAPRSLSFYFKGNEEPGMCLCRETDVNPFSCSHISSVPERGVQLKPTQEKGELDWLP